MDMDSGDLGGGFGGEEALAEVVKRPRPLPDDLPKSLDDRKSVPNQYMGETEMYDAWQGKVAQHLVPCPPVTHWLPTGQSQFLTNPILAKPLQFNNLSLDDNGYDDSDVTRQKIGDSDTRLMEMLAAQAAHRDGSASEDEEAVAASEKMSEDEKKDVLQKALNMAASNGDVERIQRILGGKAKGFVDVDAPDEEGTAPLIYASCFVSIHIGRSWGEANWDRDTKQS
jgi:hypothetical protein